jgi:diaminopimelate decarboxylase
MLYPNLTVGPSDHLYFAGYDTLSLAADYGTPLVVMDESLVRSRCRTYRAALAEDLPAGSRPLYASKAFCCKRMCEIAREEGLGLDVVSSGELYTALLAGFPPEDIFFHGNNKTDADLAFAIGHGIGYIVCDNRYELEAIEAEAAHQGVRQKILLRITPGIDPHTHEKINTGRVDSKFGSAIDTGDADVITGEALRAPHVDLRGFHCHVGSQLFDCTPLCDAAEIMVAFLRAMSDR